MINPVREDDVWLIEMRDLVKLTGPEYVADVQAITGAHKRFLARNGTTWVDTTTGTIYRADGRCMSGALRFAEEPTLTGRNVPHLKTRQKEAELRFLASMVEGATHASD